MIDRRTARTHQWPRPDSHRDWQENDETSPPMPEDAILLGDFNSVPTSPEYDVLAGPLDGEGDRLAYQEGLADHQLAHRVVQRLDHYG